MKKPAIFLDRDGTLIEEVNFLSKLEDLRLFTFTFDAIKLVKDSGFLVIVVTNQSGIARGHYNSEAMHSIHKQIQVELEGAIDGFYFCPHMPDAQCACRKPRIGMIEAAKGDFLIDMSLSWLIGDKKTDVETGINANIRSALVLTGYGHEHRSSLTKSPDIIAENLDAAVRDIIAINNGLRPESSQNCRLPNPIK